jgi:hypothetical protein
LLSCPLIRESGHTIRTVVLYRFGYIAVRIADIADHDMSPIVDLLNGDGPVKPPNP